MASSDGPFGDFGDTNVGFSGSALVTVSLVGLCFLGFTVYNIMVLRLKTREEIEDDEGNSAADYEERLVRLDVAGLSRAERRARAHAIMKQQRRIQPPRQNEQQQEGADNDGGQQIIAVGEAEIEENSDNETETVAHLSKKERQRLAKAVEKEERKFMEEERRYHQKEVEEMARKEKREREKRHAIELENERCKQRLLKQEAEQKRLTAWNTFLSTDSLTLSVEEWREELKTHRAVSIDELANRFDVPSALVIDRITELVKEKRLLGIITGDGFFVDVSEKDLGQISHQIHLRGVVSKLELVELWNLSLSAVDNAL